MTDSEMLIAEFLTRYQGQEVTIGGSTWRVKRVNWYTPREVAVMAGVTPQAVLAAARRKGWSFQKDGKYVLYYAEDVKQWIEERK